MDAHDLARWTRFAAKGGIGKCTAVVDCIAQEMGEDLMFLKASPPFVEDEITVLMQLPESGVYLGHCEGVVGRFSGKDVRFHGKLKKPVMAKRASLGAGPVDSRMSIMLVEQTGSRTDASRHVSHSPSDSRPASREKQTPSPPVHPKSHTPHMHSYSTVYSRASEDHSHGSTVVGDEHPFRSPTSSVAVVHARHAKSPQMTTSVSGASVFSVGSASIYSEASTATSIFSVVDPCSSERRRTRNGSMSSIGSGQTKKDVPGDGETEYGIVHQANGTSMPDSMSDTKLSTVPSSDGMLSTSSSISASTSRSGASFALTSTFGPGTTNGSFPSVGSISNLEAKQFDLTTLSMHTETHAGFVLVPPPLGIGDDRKSLASSVVAPLRVSKSPRLTPSPGLPPSSPLPMPPTSPGEHPRSATSISPALPSPSAYGGPGSPSPKSPTSSAPLGFPGSLSPGSPSGSFPRSPGLPGSLSPGFRGSPAFAQGAHALSQYTFSSSSSPSSSPYGSTPPSPYIHRTNAPTSPPFGPGPPVGAPLSPPPTLPLPPVPLGSPALSVVGLSMSGAGRTSPLAVPLSMPNGHGRRHDGPHGQETWEEVKERDAMRLSVRDSFCRRPGESGDGHSEDEEGPRASGDGVEEQEEEEDAQSDGEVGIGLSLMAALGGEDDEDEEEEEEADVEPAGKAGGTHSEPDGNASSIGENRGTTPMAWTCYTPTSPISVHGFNGHGRHGEEEGEGGGGDEEEEEEEDDGAYWDDIYDGYRYSRYSLASKRFSVASKASGVSKASSRARGHAPPMPAPPDRPGSGTSRPSIASDGANGHPRPSVESLTRSSMSSMPFTRPSLIRSASEESTHDLPLTAQFPAVPVHVPVRTESRLKIVHDGYTHGGDDHGEKEQRVMHGSTEDDDDDVGGVSPNIEVIQAAEEDDGQDVCVARPLTSQNAMALSPLLHTTFGSPHSSRFTDLEDGSDQDHGRRYSNKSGKSTMSSVEGPPKSPVDGGGMASALRAKVEAERGASSEAASSLQVPTLGPKPLPLPSEETSVRASVVDDDAGHVTGTNISISDPNSATEAAAPLPVPSSQTPNVVQTTVATDPVQPSHLTDQPDDAEKRFFLRPRPQPSQSPHPFARTSMFLPHPNAPKAVQHSQGPMYGRTMPQPYTYPVTSDPGAGNTTTTTPPGTTLFSTHILHQLRSLAIAASQGPARRPPMTLFARCQPDLNGSMSPVPILFSLDPFPPLPVVLPTRAQTNGVGGKGMPYGASMTPTRAATVSVPVRKGGGEGVRPGEGVGDAALLRLPKRSTTAVATNVGDAGPSSPSLPIPREGFVPQVGAARPRSRSFSAFGARVAAVAVEERSREEPVVKTQDVGSGGVPRNGSLPPAWIPH